MIQRIKILVLILFLLSINISSQNFLSPLWKISFTDTEEALQYQFNIADWKEVNLLLSWERQGYFWLEGKCCITNDFTVPANFKDSTLILSFSLQCNVESIYINGKYIGGKIPNQFWTNRGAKTEFILPKDCIRAAAKNRIVIFASNLSYTGGISHNYCSLSTKFADNYSNIKIVVPADGHLFSADDKTKKINLDYQAQRQGTIHLSIVNDFHESFFNKTFELEKGEGVVSFSFENIITRPGFYECVAILNDGSYTGDVQWFALSPDKIECTNNTAAGFKQYWDEALIELSQVKPEFNMIKIDSLCSTNRDGYIVEMKSLGGLTIRGYYFVPRTQGKHAAILHVPSYGYGWEYLNDFLTSAENVAELAICVRGHGISADVFNPGSETPGIWGYKLCSEKENAYRAIYMDCVRAVEFLLSRLEIDTSRIGVMGGSQGGGLTLVTAGLCNEKIKACAYFDPFPCDTRDQLKIRTMCNTEIKNSLKFYNDECTFDHALDIQDLIDTKGFADWIKSPAFYAAALFDDDSPPHVGFAAYNKIKSQKQFKVFANDSHLGESNPYADLMRFLKTQLEF